VRLARAGDAPDEAAGIDAPPRGDAAQRRDELGVAAFDEVVERGRDRAGELKDQLLGHRRLTASQDSR
jgi:hypothetical protein